MDKDRDSASGSQVSDPQASDASDLTEDPPVDAANNEVVPDNEDEASEASNDSTYTPPVHDGDTAEAVRKLLKMLKLKDDTSTTSTATDKDLKYKVVPPRIGGVTNHGKHQVAWTGGKPNCTWTGLEKPVKQNWNPRCERTNHYKGTSQYADRQAGLYGTQEALKFKSGDNLDFLIKKLLQAFENFGMDAICYRPDPSDSTKMINVFTEYPRLTQKAVLEQSEWVRPRFDEYDESNDEQAHTFILNSVCSKLEELLVSRSSSTDTAADLLFHLIEQERPISGDCNLAIIARVKSMSIQQQVAVRELSSIEMSTTNDRKVGLWQHPEATEATEAKEVRACVALSQRSVDELACATGGHPSDTPPASI